MAPGLNLISTLLNLDLFLKNKVKLYANLFEWRQESDYADFIDFEKDFVCELINEVEILNSELMSLLSLA